MLFEEICQMRWCLRRYASLHSMGSICMQCMVPGASQEFDKAYYAAAVASHGVHHPLLRSLPPSRCCHAQS